MSDLKDFKNKNTEFTGTSGIDLPEGTTAQQVDQQGRLRFNTDTGLAEYYNGTIWKSIDAPPAVASVSPASVGTDGSTLFTITVTGTGFDSGGISGTFIGDDGTEYNSAVNTFNSATECEIQTTAAMTAANGPYDIRITNTGSSLSGTLSDGLSGGSVPAFTTSAGSLGTVYQGSAASVLTTQQIIASDADGGDITFSITSGALPAGFALNPNNGLITGTITESDQDVTFSFTVQITDGLNTASRAFSINQDTVPTMDALIVAGGGGGGGGNRGNDNYSGCGGGGAGGFRQSSGSIALGTSKTYTITVGSGGSGGPGGNTSAQSGTSSSIAAPGITTITSAGGGYGGRETEGGAAGGSGGGGGARNGEGPGQGSAGSGNTPSVSPSQGTNGGDGANEGAGGGGGGAGGAGQAGPGTGAGGGGGTGAASSITGTSITYAGGGGGGVHSPGAGASGGSGGGGTGGRDVGPQDGTNGTANLGGGGGGSGPANTGTGSGGSGGTGVVILRIPTAQYSGTTTGSPTVTTDGTDTIVKFTGSGTITT